MSATQKHAWFNLAVVGLTLAAVGLLAGLSFRGWQGGFGILGLLGLGPLFYRQRAGEVVSDERDRQIHRNSLIVGYAAFWLVFVAASVAAPLVYGWDGAVPVALVQTSVWWAMMIVYGVASVATLVQFGVGVRHAA